MVQIFKKLVFEKLLLGFQKTIVFEFYHFCEITFFFFIVTNKILQNYYQDFGQ